jgi:cytidylate kinase
LRKAEDAVLVDTTEMDFDESVNMILRIVEEKKHA